MAVPSLTGRKAGTLPARHGLPFYRGANGCAMNRFIRKSWYTLSEAANYLAQSTEGQSKVTALDLLQLAMDDELTISLRLTQHFLHGFGGEKVFSPAELSADGAVWDDMGVMTTPFGLGENPLPCFQTIHIPPGILDITHRGGGQRLFNHLWAQTMEQTIASPGKVTTDEMLHHAITGPDAIFDENIIVSDEGPSITFTLPLNLIPEGSYLVVRTTSLDKLLSEPAAYAIASIAQQDVSLSLVATASDAERELKRLQRTVAALALGLAVNHNTYGRVGKPNVLQLAKVATEHLRDGQNDRTPHGFSESTVRQTITAALNACPELKD